MPFDTCAFRRFEKSMKRQRRSSKLMKALCVCEKNLLFKKSSRNRFMIPRAIVKQQQQLKQNLFFTKSLMKPEQS